MPYTHLPKKIWQLVFAAIVLALLFYGYFWLPERLVQYVYKGGTADYAKLIDDYRRTIVQALGGLAVAIGVYFTHKTLRVSQATLQLTRDTQITDRFARAIEHLGAIASNGQKSLEIRLGGIYSLERIAQDSPKDYWTIIEILTAYVRANREMDDWENPPEKPEHDTDADIQAILDVLGRRESALDKHKPDLRAVDLRGLSLNRLNLGAVELYGANLNEVDMSEVNLERASLYGAKLVGCGLSHAHLEAAFLDYADLREAKLIASHLNDAYLRAARLDNANLTDAVMAGAHLENASLIGAILDQSQIESAYGNELTNLPDSINKPSMWLQK